MNESVCGGEVGVVKAIMYMTCPRHGLGHEHSSTGAGARNKEGNVCSSTASVVSTGN